MTVETNANFISELNRAYPRNRDLIKEGDDHIRLVKSTIQNTFPGINSALTFTSDKLNLLDKTLTYEEEVLNINNSIQVKTGKTCDFGGAILEGVGNPKEGTDAVNLQSLQGALVWPVGSIFMTIDSRNPKEILGFGEWTKFANGRVIVGSGSTTDTSSEARTFTNEQRGGNYRVKLVEGNIPEHKHKLTKLKTNSDGAHKHKVDLRVHDYAIGNNNYWTGPNGDIAGESKRFQNTQFAQTQNDGAHTHELSGETDAYGKGDAFDTVMPYIVCNIWVRVADPT